MRGASRGDPEVEQPGGLRAGEQALSSFGLEAGQPALGVRRPRAGFASLQSGGLGTRSGATTGAPRGARWTGNGPMVSGGPKSVSAVEAALGGPTGNRRINQETRTRGQKSRDGAPRGARVLQKGTRQDGKTGAPLGAPSPRFFEGEKKRPR